MVDVFCIIEIVLRSWGGRMRENHGVGESNSKHIYQCHSVSSLCNYYMLIKKKGNGFLIPVFWKEKNTLGERENIGAE